MVIRRQDWSQREPKGSPMKKPAVGVTIHHAPERHLNEGSSRADEVGQLKIIEDYHIRTQKWQDIGYNAMFFQSARGYEGRGWGRVGAHAGTSEGNASTYGVLVCVNGNAVAGPGAMWKAVADYIREGITLGFIARYPIVRGHRDWKSTECPGSRVYQEGLLLLKREIERASSPTLPFPPAGSQVRSEYFKSNLTLVLFKSDTEWHFTVNEDPLRHGIVKAQTPWSRMPPAR
jgi:peptidoglycan recognition protein